MALQRKYRRIKMGVPECIGLGLLFSCMAIAVLTYSEFDQMNWTRTTAQVVGVQVAEPMRMQYSPISAGNNGVNVLYRFNIGSGRVSGLWRGNWVNTPILNRYRPDLVQGASSLTKIDPANPALPRYEFPSAGFHPGLGASEYSRTTRGEDFDGVVSQRRKSLSETSSIKLVSEEDDGAKGAMPYKSAHRSQKAVTLNIRYNPLDPDSSALDYPGFNLHLQTVILDLVMLLILIRFFTRTYPRMKLRGY